jgi:hypothetical protein
MSEMTGAVLHVKFPRTGRLCTVGSRYAMEILDVYLQKRASHCFDWLVPHRACVIMINKRCEGLLHSHLSIIVLFHAVLYIVINLFVLCCRRLSDAIRSAFKSFFNVILGYLTWYVA